MTWGYVDASVVPAIRDFAQAEQFWGRSASWGRPGGVYQVYMRPEDRTQGRHGLILERSADWLSVLWQDAERLRFWRDGRITTRVAGNNRGMSGGWGVPTS